MKTQRLAALFLCVFWTSWSRCTLQYWCRRTACSVWIGVFVLAYSLLPVGPSWAQKPPPPANPQAPTINPLTQPGIQRGQSLELILTGTNLASPTGVVLGCPAKVTSPTDNKNGQDNTKVTVRIDVPADTPVGWYAFRYATLKGVSNLRVFCVDDLPQVASNGTNRKPTPQPLAVPSVVSGAVNAEGDYFKITVKAGQRLSFDCLARRLGSAIDAFLTVYDAKGSRELAYDNDSPGCQTDPRISYTFKEAGDYLIEVKDVLNRGGTEFFYRLRVGDFPIATTPVPMAAKRGSKAKIGFSGPALEGAAPVDVTVPSDPTVNVVWVSPKSAAGLHGWPVALAVSDHDEIVEQEPNDDAKTATRVSVPGGVTGRFQNSADSDYYVFAGKKGLKLAIEAHTLDYYSPSLVYMVLRNAKGAEVAKTNPAAPGGADQRLEYVTPDDLDYVLEVQHLYFASGPNESDRNTIRPPTNGFDLNLTNERFDISPNGATAIPVQVVRKGYTGAIDLSAVGHPGLSGTATIKAGQNAVIMMVLAKGDLAMGPYDLSIHGKATVDGKPITQAAGAKASVVQALNGLVYPPMHLQTSFAVAVKERPPFSLAIKMDPPEGIPGGKATVTVTATRDPGFDDEITLNLPSGLPPTIPAPKVIGAITKGKNDVSFPLDLNVKTPMGEYIVFLTAKTKHKGKEFGAAAPPLMLVLGLPFDLKVETSEVSLKPGAKAKLKVTAIRKGGYQGPITIDVRKLPPNVTAAKATIADKATTTEIELSTDAKAAPSTVMDVDVSGTATALNNLTNASPVFTVRVEKK